jgi:hypothetical protein
VSRPEAFGTGEAVAHRIDTGMDAPLNWEQVKEAVAHPTSRLSRAQLVEVVAYLGAQLVGVRNSVDRDAALAMSNIRRVVDEYERRHGDGAQ